MRFLSITAVLTIVSVIVTAEPVVEQANDQSYFALALHRPEYGGIVSEPELRESMLQDLGQSFLAMSEIARQKSAILDPTAVVDPVVDPTAVVDPVVEPKGTTVTMDVAPTPTAPTDLGGAIPTPTSSGDPDVFEELPEPVVDCAHYKGSTTVFSKLADAADKILGVLPVGDFLRSFIGNAIRQTLATVAKGTAKVSSVAITIAFKALETVLYTMARQTSVVGSSVFKPMADVARTLRGFIMNFLQCSTGFPAASYHERLESEELEALMLGQCGLLADLYRGVIANTIQNRPVAPTDETMVSVEMRRLLDGSVRVLELMSKTSIAERNEDLLAVRPILSGVKALRQFREELLHLSGEDPSLMETRQYAEAALGVVINSSNALEACLRIAASPEVTSAYESAGVEDTEVEIEMDM